MCRRRPRTRRLRERGRRRADAEHRRRNRRSRRRPGKAIFINQGCGACHTYTPAGPEANGNIGPDLDKLPAVREGRRTSRSKAFVHESIVDPNKYIQTGYPKNVMPKSYASLPASDLNDLVDFLSKPQG